MWSNTHQVAAGYHRFTERVAQNIYIDKLHINSLVEADFTWWMKIMFAKHMMNSIVIVILCQLSMV